MLVAASVVGGIVAQGQAEPPAQFELQGGGAWVASAAVGQMTLIDGGSAEVIASVRVAEPGDDLGATQAGMVGYGIDRRQGTVTRVDPATFVAAPPVAVVEGARGEVSVHPSGEVVYVVDEGRGRVGVADATTVSSLRGDVLSLAEPVASSVVDDDGRLWALGASTGDLTWFDGTERGSRRGVVDDPGGAELVVVAGRAALVERAGRTVRALDGGGGFGAGSCLEIDPTDTSVVVGGSPREERLYVVSGDDGLLRISELRSGACGEVAIEVASPGSDLGEPTEAQGRVFVPDYTTGTVAIVDLDTGGVAHTGELVPPGTPFDLFDEDGIVFYNDPASERAGVVDIDGSVAEVAKYDPDSPGDGLSPDDAEDSPLPGETAAGAGEGTDPDATGGGDGADPGEGGAGADDPADEPGTAEGTDSPSAGDPTGAGPRSPADPSAPPDPNAPLAPTGPGTELGPPAPGGEQPEGDLVISARAGRVLVGESLELTATAPDGGIRTVSWDFDDQQTAEGETVEHAWDIAGAYRVVAEATLDSGRRVTDVRTIEVVERTPTVDLDAAFGFNPTTVEVGTQVTFADQSEGDPTSWLWTFEGAVGAGTSALQSPPAQTWDRAGRYTVSLSVARGEDGPDVETVEIEVLEPEGEAPLLGAVGISAPLPLNDRTTYTVDVTIVGVFTSCDWIVEGATVPCRLEASHGPGLTQAEVDHQFRAGWPTVEVVVGWGRGRTVRGSATFEVVALQSPAPQIAVSGASGSGGNYTVAENSPVTFDGSGTTGDYRVLEWRDGPGGAPVTGVAWSPTLAVGPHTIILTAVSDVFGAVQAQVTVTVESSDATAPSVQTFDATGHPGQLVVFISAHDPETGIARIDAYARIRGECLRPDGSVLPFDIDNSATPFDSGTGAELAPRSDGGPGVQFDAYIDLPCDEMTDQISTLSATFWAVATNGAGRTSRSADLVRGF